MLWGTKPNAWAAEARGAGHDRRSRNQSAKRRCVVVLRCSYAQMQSAGSHSFDRADEAAGFSERGRTRSRQGAWLRSKKTAAAAEEAE
jgi:hypothetical protein